MNFGKTDFIVFQCFEGEYFKYVSENYKSAYVNNFHLNSIILHHCIRSRIVGPWCLLVCLMEGKPIPSFQWPIFNVAMRDCVITCSHVPKKMKLEIKTKIQSMGGIYTDTLVQKNTHLVTDTVLSEKYAVSIIWLI